MSVWAWPQLKPLARREVTWAWKAQAQTIFLPHNHCQCHETILALNHKIYEEPFFLYPMYSRMYSMIVYNYIYRESGNLLPDLDFSIMLLCNSYNWNIVCGNMLTSTTLHICLHWVSSSAECLSAPVSATDDSFLPFFPFLVSLAFTRPPSYYSRGTHSAPMIMTIALMGPLVTTTSPSINFQLKHSLEEKKKKKDRWTYQKANPKTDNESIVW